MHDRAAANGSPDDRLRSLRESEERLELAARAGGLGIWEIRIGEEELLYSPRAREIWGFTADEMLTQPRVHEVIHPSDIDLVLEQSRRALDPQIRDRQPYEYRINHPELGVRWVRAYGEAVFEETGEGPRAVRYVGMMEDVTERNRMARSLEASELRQRLAVAAGRMAVCEIDLRTLTLIGNPEINRMFGFPPDATPTLDEVNARYLPGESEQTQAALVEAYNRGESHFETEARCSWPGGEVRTLLVRGQLAFDAAGQPETLVGVMIDITDRKAEEERLKLLAREVDHRANNLLSVVQATVSLTQAPDVATFKTVLSGRIAALALAHQLLAEGRWQGADLGRLLREELTPYGLGDGRRVMLKGPPVTLPPQAAQSLAMAVHELATNAAKYGALSTPAGRVRIAWAAQGGRLKLLWSESGGPVVEEPSRRGLGTAMIHRTVGGHPNGDVELDWRPSGLHCTLKLDLGRP